MAVCVSLRKYKRWLARRDILGYTQHSAARYSLSNIWTGVVTSIPNCKSICAVFQHLQLQTPITKDDSRTDPSNKDDPHALRVCKYTQRKAVHEWEFILTSRHSGRWKVPRWPESPPETWYEFSGLAQLTWILTSNRDEDFLEETTATQPPATRQSRSISQAAS